MDLNRLVLEIILGLLLRAAGLVRYLLSEVGDLAFEDLRRMF